MRAEWLNLLGVLLLQVSTGYLAIAEYVVCGFVKEACLVREVAEMPWSEEDSKPAPVAECLTATIEYITEGSSNSEDTRMFNLEWKQKKSDMNGMEGYVISSISNERGYFLYEITLDKDRIWNDHTSDEKYVTFNFREMDYFDHGALYLYSVPMYNEDSRDHFLKIIGDDRGLNISKRCGKEPDELRPPPISPSATPRTTNPMTSTKPDRGVPMRITVLACILTSVGTVLLLLMIFFIYISTCKLIGGRGLRSASRGKRKYILGKQGIMEKPPSKVFIIATTADEANDIHSDKFHQMAALGLADILCDSNLYDVSCNLWMTKEIADTGVGVWAHRMMKSHDTIIALCHKTTVAALRQWLNGDSYPNEITGAYIDPSTQVLQRFICNLPAYKRKIIACVEEDHHDCLGRLPLPYLETWKHFNLNFQFHEFIAATCEQGRCLKASMIENMRSSFMHVILKYKSENPSENFDRVNDCGSFALKCEKNPRIQTRAKSNFGRSTPEVQYDSVFSSRCNSHSTGTLSSCEDVGVHENIQKKMKHDLTRL